jgi:radical SAM protein with 4Fe4S-binding SPASM domain
MSFALFKRLIDRYVLDQQKNSPDRQKQTLSLIFHGGEPTLLDTHELIRFMNYARRKIPYIQFGMQTNLTNISAELAIILQKYGISPGISADGWHSRFNQLRTRRQSKTIFRNVRLLKQYGVNCAPLIIINKLNIRSILTNIQRMLKIFGLQDIKANYVENIYTSDPAYPEVSADELITQLFLPVINQLKKKQVIVETNIAGMLDRFFQTSLFGVNNDPDKDNVSGNCYMKFCAGGNNIVEVDADGAVCSCGRWDAVHEVCQLGFINTADPWGLRSYGKAACLQIQKARQLRKKHCDICPAQNICSYGCLAFAYAKYKDFRIREELVCAYHLKAKKYLQENSSLILKAYAGARQWPVRKIHKKIFTVELPAGFPPLNEAQISQMPGWSVVNVDGQNLLQVILC